MNIKEEKNKTTNKSSKGVILKCSLISIGIEFVIIGIMTPFRIQKSETEKVQSSNFNFSVLSKKNDVSKSKYTNGYVIGFYVSLNNKSPLSIKEFIGKMKINLESSDYTYSYDFTLYDNTNGIKANTTRKFLITIDESATNKSLALYNASIKKLQIEFKLNQINFSDNNKTTTYEEAYSVIKPYGSYAEDTDSEKQDKLNKERYDNAISLYNSGKYEEALKIFKEISSYEDSSTYIENCTEEVNKQKYEKAVSLYNSGEYYKALELFEEISTYKDSSIYIKNCNNAIKEQKYQLALSFLEEGKYDSALTIFESLSNYKDSKTQIIECKYRKAISLYESNDLANSYKLFEEIKTYKESATYMTKIEESVEYLALSGEYQQTISLLKSFGKAESNSDLYVACNNAIKGIYTSLVVLLKPTKVIVDSNLQYLQDKAFYKCENVTEIILPDSLTKIGNYAFAGCSSLKSVKLPDSIKEIGNYAFCDCTSLISFEIQSNINTLGNCVLKGCSSLETFTTKFMSKYKIQSFFWYTPSSVQTDIKNIEWPSNLSKIIISEGTSIPKYFFATLPNTIIKIEFNEEITEVGDNAFSGSKAGFYLPSSAKKIGSYSYAYLNLSDTVTLHEGLEYIGSNAFYESYFKTINIPSTVTYIGSSVFGGYNRYFEKINFNGTKEKWLSIVDSDWNYGIWSDYYEVECTDAIYYCSRIHGDKGWKDK